VSVKLYIELYLLTTLLTGNELIRKIDVNLIIMWFVFKLKHNLAYSLTDCIQHVEDHVRSCLTFTDYRRAG
jgi:hypothetical protein